MFGEITVLVVLAILFFVVANPMTYKVVDQLLSAVGMGGQIFDALTGQVSQFGVALHTVVFVALFCVYQKFVAPMMQGATVSPPEEPEEPEEVEEFMEHQDEQDFSMPEFPDGDEQPDGQPDDQLNDLPNEIPNELQNHPDHSEDNPMTNPDEMPAFEGFDSGGMGASY